MQFSFYKDIHKKLKITITIKYIIRYLQKMCDQDIEDYIEQSILHIQQIKITDNRKNSPTLRTQLDEIIRLRYIVSQMVESQQKLKDEYISKYGEIEKNIESTTQQIPTEMTKLAEQLDVNVWELPEYIAQL